MFAPPEGRLRPLYAPTLFQAPDYSAGRSLVRQLFPIRNAEMDDAYDCGRALAEMFDAAGRPSDTAVVIDLAGPQAVALAAGLAICSRRVHVRQLATSAWRRPFTSDARRGPLLPAAFRAPP